jgi:Na+/H+ antiporter NhaD/arsenite permease-like protein
MLGSICLCNTYHDTSDKWPYYMSFIDDSLKEHLIETTEVLFFILGNMTIVRIIDTHEGFSMITDLIKTTKKVTLIWILRTLIFFYQQV